MNSKTPQFDALLQPMLDALVPHTRTCLWQGKHSHCEGEFEIQEGDVEFLRMLRVPPPNYCPTCRRMRRLPHMSKTRFFKRDCDAPGHTEKMISTFPANCPFPVYDYAHFTGDNFDPFAFGVSYEVGIDGMDALWSLRQKFPLPSFLNKDSSTINSDYSSGGRNTKNAYYAGGCYEAEDVWYSNLVIKSKVVMDSRTIKNSDHVYASQKCDHLYKCSYMYFSSNSSDCMFMFDCHNCTDCFGCVNLRNAKYCVFNEQLTKEQYGKFMESVKPYKRGMLDECSKRFWSFVHELPMNASHNVAVDNVSGIGIMNSKNMYDIVDAVDSENVRHADSPLGHHDSMDLLFSGGSHHLYGTINIGSSSSWVKFSVSSKFCTDCEYVFNSKYLTNCFMCFGLQNKSYCILNKQYEPEEYFRIVDDIKSSLLQSGKYADGLGIEYSALGYDISLASIAYPLTNEEILALGGYIAEAPETNIGDIVVVDAQDVPETIQEVSVDILTKAIRCQISGRPFRVIASELDFYRKMGLPLPTIHPELRIEETLRLVPTGKKYSAVCSCCSKNIYSILDPENGYNLYCESCYQKEVL